MKDLIEAWYTLPQEEFAKKFEEHAAREGKVECDLWVEFLAMIDPDERLDET